jgi:phage shock protein C
MMAMYPESTTRSRIYRSRRDSWLMGVCGGIAEYFKFPSWAVRLILILLTVFSSPTIIGVPLFLVLYVIAAMVMKPAPDRSFRNREDENFWNTWQDSRPDAMATVRKRFETLEKRLQRLESIVTYPHFERDEEFRNLER